MNIAGHDIGVCSWSLRPSSTAELISLTKQLGLEHVQLAIGSLLGPDDRARRADMDLLRASGLKITAGMIGFPGEDYSTIATIRDTGGYVPDALWPERRDLTIAAAKLVSQLGVGMLSTHVGFIPASNRPTYRVMLTRLKEVATAMADLDVALVMETGQEQATELLQFMNDLSVRSIFVNFDPANMVLYGAGDPIEAVRVLGRHIRHVHVKDGILSSQPGVTWGTEVPFGTGQVKPAEFLNALNSAGYTGPLCIEREAGEDRIADVSAAIAALQSRGQEP